MPWPSSFATICFATDCPARKWIHASNNPGSRINSSPVVIVLCMDMSEMDVYSDARRADAERMMAIQSTAAAGFTAAFGGARRRAVWRLDLRSVVRSGRGTSDFGFGSVVGATSHVLHWSSGSGAKNKDHENPSGMWFGYVKGKCQIGDLCPNGLDHPCSKLQSLVFCFCHEDRCSCGRRRRRQARRWSRTNPSIPRT